MYFFALFDDVTPNLFKIVEMKTIIKKQIVENHWDKLKFPVSKAGCICSPPQNLLTYNGTPTSVKVLELYFCPFLR